MAGCSFPDTGNKFVGGGTRGFAAACMVAAFLAFPGSTVRAEPARYYVPPPRFSAAFQIMDLGFSNIMGLFRSATAGFDFDEDSKTLSRLRIAIAADSVVTATGGGSELAGAIGGGPHYPEITFSAMAPQKFENDKAEIKGTVTAHGVAKTVTFDAKINHVGNSPHGGGMWNSEGKALGLSLKGAFKRSDFGTGDAADQAERFGDEVTLLLEMQAIKQ